MDDTTYSMGVSRDLSLIEHRLPPILPSLSLVLTGLYGRSSQARVIVCLKAIDESSEYGVFVEAFSYLKKANLRRHFRNRKEAAAASSLEKPWTPVPTYREPRAI